MVTEALASGVPVVAVDGPGIGEIVMDYTNGRLLKITIQMHFAMHSFGFTD